MYCSCKNPSLHSRTHVWELTTCLQLQFQEIYTPFWPPYTLRFHVWIHTQPQRYIIKTKTKSLKQNTIEDYTAIKRTNTCCNTNRSGEHYAKSKKPITVDHTLYDFIRNVQNMHIYGSRRLSKSSVPLEQINEEWLLAGTRLPLRLMKLPWD